MVLMRLPGQVLPDIGTLMPASFPADARFSETIDATDWYAFTVEGKRRGGERERR